MKSSILKYSRRIALLVIIAGLASCKEYLNLSPKDVATDETTFGSAPNADLFLNNVYSGLLAGGSGNRASTNEDPYEDWSDNALGKVASENSNSVHNKAAYTATTSSYGDWWGLYTQIRKANLFIEKVTASTALPDSYKKSRLAEARFIRAFFYESIWEHHGACPIITDVLNLSEDGDAIFRPKNTEAEVVKFLSDELTACAADLPVTQGDKGRPTKGAALALRGWIELYNASPLKNPTNDKAKWALAAATYKSVMDLSGTGYALFPDREKMGWTANNNNSESIWARQFLGQVTGTSREGVQGPTFVGGLQVSWGGVNPTHDIVAEYQMANGKDITDPTSGYDPNNPYIGREPRFYQDIVYDGCTWLGKLMTFRVGSGDAGEIDFGTGNDKSKTGYWLRKLLDPQFAINGPNGLSGANFMWIRYADVLLGYAEAQNEAVSPDGSVYSAVNQVRTRAGLPGLPTGLDQAGMRKAILHERRVEFFMEERRYPDLLRWKLAETIMNIQSTGMRVDRVGSTNTYTVFKVANGNRIFKAPQNYLLPIPQSVIDKNSKITQNPGY